MKYNKLIALLGFSLVFGLASCGETPSEKPTEKPTDTPTIVDPTVTPTEQPSITPSETPTEGPVVEGDWNKEELRLFNLYLDGYKLPFIKDSTHKLYKDPEYGCICYQVEGLGNSYIEKYAELLSKDGFIHTVDETEFGNDEYYKKVVSDLKYYRIDLYSDELDRMNVDIYYFNEDPNDFINGWSPYVIALSKDYINGYLLPDLSSIVDTSGYWQWTSSFECLSWYPDVAFSDANIESIKTELLKCEYGAEDITDPELGGATIINYIGDELGSYMYIDVYTYEGTSAIDITPYIYYSSYPSEEIRKDLEELGMEGVNLPEYKDPNAKFTLSQYTYYQEDGYSIQIENTSIDKLNEYKLTLESDPKFIKVEELGYNIEGSNQSLLIKEVEEGIIRLVIQDGKINQLPDEEYGKSQYGFMSEDQITSKEKDMVTWETKNTYLTVLQGESTISVGNELQYLVNPLRVYQDQIISLGTKDEAPLTKVEYILDQDKYIEPFKNVIDSTLFNVEVNGVIVTVTPINKQSIINFTLNAQVRFSSITLYF